MAVSVSLVSESLIGITIAVPFVHYSLAVFSMANHLNTDEKMTFMNYLVFFLAYGV